MRITATRTPDAARSVVTRDPRRLRLTTTVNGLVVECAIRGVSVLRDPVREVPA